MCSKKAVSVKVRKDIYKKVKKNLEKFSKKDLLVGVPQEKSQREDGDRSISNAELMFIHTNGSPARNIPKRPTIEPTIAENKKEISSKFKAAILKILQDKGDGMTDLEKIGLWVVNKIKAKFGSDELAPNAPATIKAKGSDRPLIDTTQVII